MWVKRRAARACLSFGPWLWAFGFWPCLWLLPVALCVALAIAVLCAIKIALAFFNVSLNQISMPKVLELKLPTLERLKSKRPIEGKIIQVHRKTYEHDADGNLVAIYTALPFQHVFRDGKWQSNEIRGVLI